MLDAAARREPGALDQLIEEHLGDIRAFVRLQVDPALRARESQSDIVQSVCREVLEHLPQFEFRGTGSFRAWLFTAALNKVRQKGEFHRAQKRDVAREVRADSAVQGDAVGPGLYASLCHVGPSPSEHAIAHEQAARIEQAIDALPADYRQALLLARLVGLTHKEIAERMDRTEASVRSLISRASLGLLARLEERD